MRALRQAALIAEKDLRLFVRDRWALVFAIAFPLVFVFAFSLFFGEAAAEDAPIHVVLATEERDDSISAGIIVGMTGSPDLSAERLPPEEARRRVEDGDLAGFILFPAGFTDAVLSGERAEIRVVSDPEGDAMTRGWLGGLAGSVAADLTRRGTVQQVAARLVADSAGADMAAFGQALGAYLAGDGEAGAGELVQWEQAGEVEAVRQSNVQLPGYLTMFVFFVAAFAASELVKERDNHTLDRLIAGGAGRGTILMGKWLGTVVRGLFQAAVLWTVGVLLFNVDMGRAPLGTALITVAMVLVSASWAMLLASVAKSERSAGSLAVLSALVLAPLGGCWWPLFVMSDWMQKLARITPHAWANDAFNRLLLFGAGTADTLVNLLVLAGFAVLFLVAGLLRLRTTV